MIKSKTRMFLSNPRKITLSILFFAALSTACWPSAGDPAKNVSLTGEPLGEFPFSTVEPAVYSANVFTTAGDAQKHWFIARKNEKWRLDIFRGDALSVSQIFNGKFYQIDHSAKTFTELPTTGDPITAMPFGNSAYDPFRGHEHFEFEEAGREGTVIKYNARSDSSKGDIVILYDTSLNMLVREEFYGPDGSLSFVYELKDIKKEVDDSVFELPTQYKRIN